MHKRIKLIRTTLKLTQQEFGERLGVSRDVIGNLEGDRVKPKDYFIKHMCEIFAIREDWLRTGSGNMLDSAVVSPERLNEVLSIFSTLVPPFQDYALQQIKELLKLQESTEK